MREKERERDRPTDPLSDCVSVTLQKLCPAGPRGTANSNQPQTAYNRETPIASGSRYNNCFSKPPLRQLLATQHRFSRLQLHQTLATKLFLTRPLCQAPATKSFPKALRGDGAAVTFQDKISREARDCVYMYVSLYLYIYIYIYICTYVFHVRFKFSVQIVPVNMLRVRCCQNL